MERVWIVSEDLYSRRDSVPANRHAEIEVVPTLAAFREKVNEGERAVLLGSLAVLKQAKEEFPRLLACQLLPKELTQERLLYSVRAALLGARLQHDLEAAENVAWSGMGVGQYDDPGLELLGSSVLELAAARDMEAVEEVLLQACARIVPVLEVRVIAYPETASSRVMGFYQLAVPVQFQGVLKAHIYIRFEAAPEQPVLDKVGEALLNLSDGVALAVERNTMISRAEETKTVWEASFDAVEDPVAILDDGYFLVRANRAYGRLAGVPLVKLPGREPGLVAVSELCAFPVDHSSEWAIEIQGRHFRAFLDPILTSLGPARFVFRLHDVTEERTLTEKILAKEQVAELGILVGSVAHEINNPIGGILAIGQILQKDVEKGSSLSEDVENIVQSAERCRKIVQTMLSLVRKADEEKGPVSVGAVLQSSADLLGSEAKRLQVRLRVSAAGGAEITGNKNRLLQVFFHLLQHSLLAVAERRARQPSFEAFLNVDLIPGFGNLEVRIEDNGDPVKHEYEIQSSVAFTVAKMILDEHDASFMFVKGDGRNQQRVIFGQG